MIAELTNNLRKAFASLATAKGRKQLGWWMAQGSKCVADTLPHFEPVCLLATDEWISEHPRQQALKVKKSDLERISTLTSVPDVIAIYMMPDRPAQDPQPGSLYLALDCVQDPGNLGTIIRVADWMGVDTIYASADTADVWNPKVIQATMGAIARVKVIYTDLPPLLKAASLKMPVYGTFLDGDNIYSAPIGESGIIVMGNEGNGISSDVAACVTQRLLIPSFPPGRPTSESLNVAIATAITLSIFRAPCKL